MVSPRKGSGRDVCAERLMSPWIVPGPATSSEVGGRAPAHADQSAIAPRPSAQAPTRRPWAVATLRPIVDPRDRARALGAADPRNWQPGAVIVTLPVEAPA